MSQYSNSYIASQRLALAQGRAAFGQEATTERLSMDGEKEMLQRAAGLLHLTEQRTQLENLRNKTLAAAYAIHHFGDLNPADPQFKQKYYQYLQDFHEGLEDKGVQEIITAKQADYSRFQAAQAEALKSNYSGPELQAYEHTLSQSGNPDLAHAAALGVRAQTKEVNDILASPDLTDAEKAKFIHPATRQFDIGGAQELIARKQGTAANTNEQYNMLAAQNGHLLKVRNSLLHKSSGDSLQAGIDALNDPQGTASLNPDEKAMLDTIGKSLRSNVERMSAIAQGQSPGAPASDANPNAPIMRLMQMPGFQPPAAPAASPTTPAPAATPAPATPSPVSAAPVPNTDTSKTADVAPLPESMTTLPAQPFTLASTAEGAIQQPGVPPVNPENNGAAA
jgi:hypothetical protein